MPIADKLNYLVETKKQIRNAIQEKGIEVLETDPFKKYSDKIKLIQTSTSSSEWQPQPDWWEIDKILEEDTEDFICKIIVLLNDSSPKITINANNLDKIKFSDEIILESPQNGNITHEFNDEYDKACSFGYKTRYMILYSNTERIYDGTNILFANNNIDNLQPLYIIIKMGLYSSRNLFNGLINLQCIKFIDTKISTILSISFNNCQSLERIDGLQYLESLNDFTLNLSFQNCYKLTTRQFEKFKLPENYKDMDLWYWWQNSIEANIKMPKNIDFSRVAHYRNVFQSSKIQTIDFIDFTNVQSNSNTVNLFQNCNNLINIGEIRGSIKIKNLILNLAYSLNHDTLIRILNALEDYSLESSPYTLILGAQNLSKLTDDEKSIATDKGWTLS